MQTLLAQYGYTDRIEQRYKNNFDHPCPARVIRVDKTLILVAGANGPVQVSYPRLDEKCATGDWIQLETGESGDRITAVLERYSMLARKIAHDPRTDVQVLAANVDVVGVVVPIDRPISHNRLERTLVAAWDSGGTPLVILTKADLSNGNDDVVSQTIDQAAGVDVVTTSAEYGDGLQELMLHIHPAQTLVLLGPSGSGKSTLINALAGEHLQDTGGVRAVDGRGKHTTTARELIPLTNGAVLMDTPGVRGFALWESHTGMDAVFSDIEELFSQCRFQDCNHGPEPDCAVRAALAVGTLEPRRWKSYLKLQRELARLARQHDEMARRNYGREQPRSVKAQAEARRQHGE